MVFQPILEFCKMRVDSRSDLWNCRFRELPVGQETNEPLDATQVLERRSILPAVPAPFAAMSCKPLDDIAIDGTDYDSRAAQPFTKVTGAVVVDYVIALVRLLYEIDESPTIMLSK
jgi:hypothetical protein